MKKQSDPPNGKVTIVIFGATGDLTKRKLLPGLYNILYQNPEDFSFELVAIGRRRFSNAGENREASFEALVEDSIRAHSRWPFEEDKFQCLMGVIRYHRMDMSKTADYQGLRDALDSIDNMGNRLYYLATSAKFFEIVTENLASVGMHKSDHGWRRLVIEKPFGSDLETAKGLNSQIKRYFDESQIFRIDHYLGKEMTQNILMMRGKNAIFNAVWNNEFIDHIQITVSEDMGVENRASYYDKSGAMRDMIQNHLLQIVALTTMRFCDINDTEAVRDAKALIFNSLKTFSHDDLHRNVVLGQYKGYTDAVDIPDDSLTETYTAMKLEVDLHEWVGVPIYLRTGKCLNRKEAYVMIEFKRGRFCRPEGDEKPNRLVIKIQPEEGVSFYFNVKKPGNTLDVNEVEMDFCQTCNLNYNSPEAYESLLLDAAEGDQTRFTRWDEVEGAWAFMDKIIKHCEDRNDWIEVYERGGWGPEGALKLIEQDGRKWWSYYENY